MDEIIEIANRIVKKKKDFMIRTLSRGLATIHSIFLNIRLKSEGEKIIVTILTKYNDGILSFEKSYFEDLEEIEKDIDHIEELFAKLKVAENI